MRIRYIGCLCLFLGAFFQGYSSYGGDLLLGMGYGEQIGERSSQNNGIVDVSYDFYAWEKSRIQFLLGAGVSWLWTDFRDGEELHMVSILPSVRCYLGESKYFKPYIFLTIGPSYLSEDQLGMQRQGGHVTFNDSLGVGTYIGSEKRWSVRWSWRHISNGSTRSPNEGIDVVYYLSVGRKF